VIVLIEMERNDEKIFKTTLFSNITPCIFVEKLPTFRVNIILPSYGMKKEAFFTVTAERTPNFFN
jgi:hypothetical protein